MKAKFYAAEEGRAMLYVSIVAGKKEIFVSMCDAQTRNWHDLTLNVKQAEGLRKFLEDNNWS